MGGPKSPQHTSSPRTRGQLHRRHGLVRLLLSRGTLQVCARYACCGRFRLRAVNDVLTAQCCKDHMRAGCFCYTARHTHTQYNNTQIHICIHTHTRTHMQIRTHKCAHTHECTHAHTHKLTQACTHTHARVHRQRVLLVLGAE